MKRLTLASLLFFGLLAAGWAAEPALKISPKKIRDDVRSVVEGQLLALRKEDFKSAYRYSAAGIKAQFDERVFAVMIRRGYPALLRNESADIGIVRDNGRGEAQVVVTVTDAVKRDTVYRFWLVNEEFGWKVAGVVLEQKPPRGDI